MNIQTNTPTLVSNRDVMIIFFVVAYVISFFLYYIDEGNYHFNGLANPAEWIFLSVYALIFAGSFRLVYHFLKKTALPNFIKLISSIVLGIFVLPTIVVILSFFVSLF